MKAMYKSGLVIIIGLFSMVYRIGAQVMPFDSITSYLMIYDLEARTSRVVYKVKSHFEAPNWTKDGNFLVFNCHGRLYKKIAFGCDEPSRLESGIAVNCNNDHGYSPDGKWMAISHVQDGKSLIYIIPGSGGDARQITTLGPSFW